MLCIKMPIDNLSNLERTFVQLFEENGYVESYEKNEYHINSPHHIYFLKNIYRLISKTTESVVSIQCGIKYSRLYEYVEFVVYVENRDCPEATLKETVQLDTDVDTDKYSFIEEIKNLLLKSERMCSFIHLIFDMGHWVVNMPELCTIFIYCGKCSNVIFKISEISSIGLGAHPQYEEYKNVDVYDLDETHLSKHICRE